MIGGNGWGGILQASLADAVKPVLVKVCELKEKLEARKAAEEAIASQLLIETKAYWRTFMRT